jgi:hypothetical protein
VGNCSQLDRGSVEVEIRCVGQRLPPIWQRTG